MFIIVGWAREGNGMEREKDSPTSLMVFFFLSNKMFSILRSLCVCGDGSEVGGGGELTFSLIKQLSLVPTSFIN